jgi:ribosomal protein L3
MGAANVKVKNLVVVGKDEAKGLLLIAGAVPGASNGSVRVTHAKKHSR